MHMKFLSAGLATLGSAMLVLAAPAGAQPAQSADAQLEVVVVTAPSVVFHELKSAAASRVLGRGMARSVSVITVNRSVSYADLDLTKDAAIFEKRINDAAAEACRVLDKRYPKSVYIPVSPNEDCAANAAANAMKVANQVIAAAKQK